MELTNEVTLGEDVYCFESVQRVAAARAWIDANGDDTTRFRRAFPDARRVSTHPYGSGGQRGDQTTTGTVLPGVPERRLVQRAQRSGDSDEIE